MSSIDQMLTRGRTGMIRYDTSMLLFKIISDITILLYQLSDSGLANK